MASDIILLLVILMSCPVKSKESLRFQYTYEQGFDTSCGMSVVATALDRYWGVPTDEVELIGSALGDKIEEGDYTVSLADMAKAFEERGVAARAFRPMGCRSVTRSSSEGVFAPLVTLRIISRKY